MTDNKNKVDIYTMFSKRAIEVLEFDCTAKLITVIDCLYDNVFMYCMPGSELDYNYLPFEKRQEIAMMHKNIKQVLQVIGSYEGKYFRTNKVFISNDEALIIAAAFDAIYCQCTQEEILSHLESMLIVTLVDRLKTSDKAPGEKESEIAYNYLLIKDFLKGYKVVKPEYKKSNQEQIFVA